MKTELEIAKENIDTIKEYENMMKKQGTKDKSSWRSLSRIHKATCQRWLEFLKAKQGLGIQMKIKDLKQAIKLYEENRI